MLNTNAKTVIVKKLLILFEFVFVPVLHSEIVAK